MREAVSSLSQRIIDMEDEILSLKGTIAELKEQKKRKTKPKIPAPLSVRYTSIQHYFLGVREI